MRTTSTRSRRPRSAARASAAKRPPVAYSAAELALADSTSPRLSGVMSASSTGWSAGPTCQTAMNLSKRSGSRHGGVSSRTSCPSSARSVGGGCERGDALGIDGYVDRRRGGDRDAEARRLLARRLGERPLGRRRPPRIARLVAGEDVEEVRGVLDRPRDGTSGRKALERAERRARHPPAGGLQPEEAAARRWDADRAASVRSVSDRHEPRGQRRRSAAARAAGRELACSTGSGSPRSAPTP